jgi:hypothetical protein
MFREWLLMLTSLILYVEETNTLEDNSSISLSKFIILLNRSYSSCLWVFLCFILGMNCSTRFFLGITAYPLFIERSGTLRSKSHGGSLVGDSVPCSLAALKIFIRVLFLLLRIGGGWLTTYVYSVGSGS